MNDEAIQELERIVRLLKENKIEIVKPRIRTQLNKIMSCGEPEYIPSGFYTIDFEVYGDNYEVIQNKD